ncbi:acetyltransferase-like protein [Apiospora saccharicola]|uniref:Acetyltransferase-like protein n=1 Tax=Apiospora saccharicola TaxID=335842 RepID=A0ABR1U1P7_9PEZI
MLCALHIEPFARDLARLANDCAPSDATDTSFRFCAPYPEDPELYWQTVVGPPGRRRERREQPRIASVVYVFVDKRFTHILAALQLAKYEVDPTKAKIMNVMVSPEHRRKGLARALVAHAEEEFRQQGTKKIVAHAKSHSPGHCLFWDMDYKEYKPAEGDIIEVMEGVIKEHVYLAKDLSQNETQTGGQDTTKEEQVGEEKGGQDATKEEQVGKESGGQDVIKE